jgi:hypothetical protein
MKMYTNEVVQNLIDNYIKKNGEVIEVVEGCLGYGTTICLGDGLKYAIIQEVFLNHWNSGHTIKMFNKLPKKYEKLLEQVN